MLTDARGQEHKRIGNYAMSNKVSESDIKEGGAKKFVDVAYHEWFDNLFL